MKKQICIAQINYGKESPYHHIQKIKDIIAKNKSSDLIVFPELILHGHPSLEIPEGLLYRRLKKFYASLREESDDLYKFVKNVNARVIIGELKGVAGSFYNVATYVDRDTLQNYAKTHVHWTENFIPGDKLKVFHTPFGPVGITICFDGAFSETWRVLALKGAPIIVNIAAVPRTFPVHYIWRRLEGAAISNQVFIVYANRPGDYFSGNSAVFDPRGEPIIKAGEEEVILNTEIDLRDLMLWREEESLYRYRRPLLYRDIIRRPPGQKNSLLFQHQVINKNFKKTAYES